MSESSGEAPYDLVIWDCDGVLVDSERLSVEVEARVLTQLGWPLTAADIVSRWMGRSFTDQLTEVAAHLGEEASARFDELSTAELHRAFEQLVAVEGVVEVLDALDATGVATCVASSGSHDMIRLRLSLTGLTTRFDGRVFSRTDVTLGKPEPDLFLHAASSMGVEPVRCAVVEDSVYGVRAGVAAGMTVYGYAGGLTEGRLLAEAGAVVVEDMRDLIGALI